jgi:hypothetical protein
MTDNPSAAMPAIAAFPSFWTEGMKRASSAGGKSRKFRAGAFGMTSRCPSVRGMMSMKESETSSS